MGLEWFHGQARLHADSVVFKFGLIYLTDNFLELIEGQIFVKLQGDIVFGVVVLFEFGSFDGRFGLFAFDDIINGSFQDVALTVFRQFIQQFCVFRLQSGDLIEMVLLNLLQSADLGFKQLLLLYDHLGDLGFASVGTSFQDLGHRLKRFSDVVVDSLDDGGDVFVEVVEVGDYFYEAEIDEGVTTADDTAVNFLLPGGCRQFD